MLHAQKDKKSNVRFKALDNTQPPHIKSPLYLESQCYPSKKSTSTLSKQLLKLEKSKTIESSTFRVVGINFSISELRAFRAIQRLFTLVEYQGNMHEKRTYYDGNNPFNFIGFITPLKIRIADFLRAYGVNEQLKNNGSSRFNAHEREEALKALAQISSKIFYCYFTKNKTPYPHNNHEHEHRNLMQVAEPLFKYYTQHELDRLHSNNKPPSRIDYIIIEPMPIMLYGIDKYYMLIPPYETEIRQASQGKRIPKEIYTFVGYLIYQAEFQRKSNYRDWLTITIDIEQLIITLRLDHYFTKKSRNPKKAHTIIDTTIEYACKTGYVYSFIKDHEQKKTVFTFYLNDQKFSPIQALQNT